MTSELKSAYWYKLLAKTGKLVEASSHINTKKGMLEQICKLMLTGEDRLIKLVKDEFNLTDILNIKNRLIGTGFIGGKSLGMFLARKILENNSEFNDQNYLEEHDSFFIGSDVFNEYLVENGLWKPWVKLKMNPGDSEAIISLQKRMLEGSFPEEIIKQFHKILNYFGQLPIIVRSSSLLEDNYGNSFAGKYDSFFCVNQGDFKERCSHFKNVIRKIYASILNRDALVYRKEKGLDQQDEKMALLVQKVSGKCHHHKYFFPLAAGVGFSYNYFNWKKELNPEAGMLRLVSGLGTRAVNRGIKDYPRIVFLDNPLLKINSSKKEERKFSQQYIDILNLRKNKKETILISELMAAVPELNYRNLLGIRDEETNQKIKKLGIKGRDAWLVNFDKLLVETKFVNIIKGMLKILEQAYNHPVSIEFTVNFTEDGNLKINLLQCRPLQTYYKKEPVGLPGNLNKKNILFKTKGNFMGGNTLHEITKFIFVEPAEYTKLKLRDKYKISRLIGRLNQKIGRQERESILLMGPGRWGTEMPSLGIPVKFSEINNIDVLIEMVFNNGNTVPRISFGTHFFHDLIENRVLYLAITPQDNDCLFSRDKFKNFANILDNLLPEEKAYKKCLQVYNFKESKLKVISDIKEQIVTGFF